MTQNNKQRASPAKKAERKARPNRLDKRITWASQDLDTIMKDLQRDCKPYYKIVDLVRELADISHDVKELTKDNARIVKAKQKAAAELRVLKAEIEKTAKLAAEVMANRAEAKCVV